MQNILLVGGAGYIGSHMAKILKKNGYGVIVLDDFSTGHQEFTRYGILYEGSASDSSLVERIFKDHQISTVMHFAAKALVGESVEKPLYYYTSNVSNTIVLLETMLKCGVKNFIFSSTCSTFGNHNVEKMNENLPPNPLNPYGSSKLIVENILKDLGFSHGLNTAVLRYFNAAGADPDAEIGERHDPETHLIPLALRAAYSAANPLTVYGNDYPTPDGSCIRDYIHVVDIADAHMLAMKWLEKNKGYHDFNLGSEDGNSVLEVIAMVEKVTGKKVNYKTGNRRSGDPTRLVGDSTKARNILEWKPRFSFEEIVKTAHSWHSKERR